MNILEKLNLAKRGREIVKITTPRDFRIGETFEFASNELIKTGDMVYICHPRNFSYGRAIITNNPRSKIFVARRTS